MNCKRWLLRILMLFCKGKKDSQNSCGAARESAGAFAIPGFSRAMPFCMSQSSGQQQKGNVMIQTSTQIKLTCGCGKGSARRTLTAQEVQKILAYSEAGKSRKVIARLMHIKRRVMLRELSKAGITLPKRCGCFQSRHL